MKTSANRKSVKLNEAQIKRLICKIIKESNISSVEQEYSESTSSALAAAESITAVITNRSLFSEDVEERDNAIGDLERSVEILQDWVYAISQAVSYDVQQD